MHSICIRFQNSRAGSHHTANTVLNYGGMAAEPLGCPVVSGTRMLAADSVAPCSRLSL